MALSAADVLVLESIQAPTRETNGAPHVCSGAGVTAFGQSAFAEVPPGHPRRPGQKSGSSRSPTGGLGTHLRHLQPAELDCGRAVVLASGAPATLIPHTALIHRPPQDSVEASLKKYSPPPEEEPFSVSDAPTANLRSGEQRKQSPTADDLGFFHTNAPVPNASTSEDEKEQLKSAKVVHRVVFLARPSHVSRPWAARGQNVMAIDMGAPAPRRSHRHERLVARPRRPPHMRVLQDPQGPCNCGMKNHRNPEHQEPKKAPECRFHTWTQPPAQNTLKKCGYLRRFPQFKCRR